MAHAAAQLKDLVVLLQDGSRLTLQRDDEDSFVVTAFEPAPGGKHAALAVPAGSSLEGFGPWPTWTTNTRNRVATLPDDESGLFEPERLFVLREQYAFVGAGEHPLSLGPIRTIHWAGTEHVVQARAGH